MTASALGVALEDIPAGAAVQLDLKTGRIRRTTPPVEVHAITIQLRIAMSGPDSTDRPVGVVVCSCDVERPLLHLDSETAFDQAADVVNAHLAAASEEAEPAPETAIQRGRYAADVAEHLLGGRRVLVALPSHPDVDDELRQLEHAIAAVLPASVRESIVTRRTNGAQGFRSRAGGRVDLVVPAPRLRGAEAIADVVYVPLHAWLRNARRAPSDHFDELNRLTDAVVESGGRAVRVEGQ